LREPEMETKDFIKFIESLSVIKDLEERTELIKNELKELNKMIRENINLEYNSRLDKVEKQVEYMELLYYKNVLSSNLSLLQSENNFR
jgi:glycyl-tRNA synthetase beta subunit